MNSKIAKPFLKWAGGKTQLLNEIVSNLPEPHDNIKCYVEPFVGSGAVVLHLAQTLDNLKEIYINDLNPELILVWNVIKYNVKELKEELKGFHKKFNPENITKEERLTIYKDVRADFNKGISLLINVNFEDFKNNKEEISEFCIKRASQFIFLNKTCFNGLYRVNKKGEFNVPMGDYKEPKILDKDNLEKVNELLLSKEIKILPPSDYKETIKPIKKLMEKGFESKNIFVYFDPPYKPISASSSFTSYSKYDFKDNNQEELAKFFKELDELKINVMLSNSDPTNDENSNYFDNLYKDYAMETDEKGIKRVGRVMANRNINSKGTGRGKISEILVTNKKNDTVS